MGGTGRKLPKRHTYKKESTKTGKTSKFPDCIGTFPECKEYTADMPIESRPECRSCPFY